MLIPEVREELLKIADKADTWGKCKTAAKIRYLVTELYRRQRVPRTAAKSKTITPRLQKHMKAYKLAHPAASEQDIAVHFGVNAGRVSEALAGKRK
jgi:hypothetical protein